MVRLLEYPLEAGGSVLIQVEDGRGGDAEVTRGWADRDRRVVERRAVAFPIILPAAPAPGPGR